MGRTPVAFHEAGAITDKINVEISFQIIGLFSEGLYSSPNKAIEELVSNAFDADATRVHVVLSPDRAAADATIAVVDNGTGMDDQGLKIHWIVGDSVKSRNRTTSSGRRTIGKFGIGKLAAYVLGDRLTHITKAGGKFYSTSMDFRTIPKTADVDGLTQDGTRSSADPVQLDLRELTAAEAKAALGPWLSTADGLDDMQLFGANAESTWTVAIISDLKDMAVELSPGMLRWVLSTAMPLRDDFALFLNGGRVSSSKLTTRRVGRWTLGRTITSPPKPAPTEMEVDTDESVSAPNYRRWRLTDRLLGPMTGYVEVYAAPIDTGKSAALVGRSNGFFVYVHGRLINPEDAGFGIDRNKLRHGTFSRFRVVINIDRLDGELRSSREKLRDGPMLERARELLQGLFNFARAKLEKDESSKTTERRASERLSDSPASLTERPILQMLLDAFDGSITPRHLAGIDHSTFQDRDQLRAHVEARIEAGDGLVADIVYADLGTHEPMAVLDAATGTLSINLEHPFVAHFADEFGDKKKNLPLQLFAISEILLEAELHNANVDPEAMATVLDSRDELLRHLARSSGAQNSLTVAHDLLSAASSAKELEAAVVVAFRQLGFEAVPRAGKDEADGIAEAYLPAGHDGTNHYRVSLEAKSKEKPGGKVKKKAVEVSTIARHRTEANCDHAIVVGPDFETGADNLGAVIREIDADREAYPGKTITLMRIVDLARLVRVAPLKRVNLEQLRKLFDARSPDEAATWVDTLAASDVGPGPYQAILETVWTIQQDDKEHSVDYGSLRTALRMGPKKLTLTHDDLKNECAALSRMAPNLFFAREDRVELNIRPDKVLDVLHDYVDRLPIENEE
jgi:histidine kinase/DNA gyrase B/HSP90-like ATPase